MPVVPTIDSDRLWSRLIDLATIGATGDGGVDRQALTEGESDAWDKIIAWSREAGLEVATDAAANLFVTLPGRGRSAAPILMGSHIDTQPTGGRFDGAFGVMAALEVLVTLSEAEIVPDRCLRAVAWMNEEGSRFAPGMMGSGLFVGQRDLAEVRAAKDADGNLLGDALDRHLKRFESLERLPLGFSVSAYIEPHIEQAKVLQHLGKPIGVVTGIQGKKTWEMKISGREAHAGTEPIGERRDALKAFVSIAAAMYAAIDWEGEPARFTIGRIEMAPNAPSVVPAALRFRIDLRHPDNSALDRLCTVLEEIATAKASPCMIDIKALVDEPGNGFDKDLQAIITEAASLEGLDSARLISAAGHDARYLSRVAPSAMIFIPCRDGVSHHPDEWAEPKHVAGAAAVLLRTVNNLLAIPNTAL